jgi:putative PIN family toxin of toxin-antitoxin system
MKIILDSNVFLSALISPHSPSDVIYRAWRARQFEVITSDIQLEEIRRASRYPKFRKILQPAKVGAMINNLQNAIILEKITIKDEADDPNDSFLIAMALAGKADYLVTGDKRAGLLKKKHIKKTKVVTPAQFIDILQL